MTAWEPTANKKKSRIAAWRIYRYNLRWAINPAGHSPRSPVPGPRHTHKVLELVSKLVVHSSINDCSSDSCQNGGTCTDMVDGFSCTCVSGYTGTICQTGKRQLTWGGERPWLLVGSIATPGLVRFWNITISFTPIYLSTRGYKV